MNKKTLERNLLLIAGGAARQSTLSKTFIRSPELAKLLQSGTVVRAEQGRGFIYQVGDRNAFDDYFNYHFPDRGNAEGTRASNVRRYRDSKANRRESEQLILVRSGIDFNLDGRPVAPTGLGSPLFHAVHGRDIESLRCARICIVENLENFLAAERVMGEEWLFLHPYGRLGAALVGKIDTGTLLHWGDFDIVGLNEYALIKSVHPNARLYLPENFTALSRTFARRATGNQKVSAALEKLLDTDPDARAVYDLWAKERIFLEQEEALDGN